MKIYELMLDPKFDIQNYVDEKDKEIERLKEQIEEYKKFRRKFNGYYGLSGANMIKNNEIYIKEIDRLNNIINELEKELKEYFNRIGENKKYVDTFYSQAIYNDIEHILNKLKELKENNK